MKKLLLLAMFFSAFGSQALAGTDSYDLYRIDKAVIHFDVTRDFKPYMRVGRSTLWVKTVTQSRLLKALGIDGRELAENFKNFVGNHRYHDQTKSMPFEFVGFTDGSEIVLVKMNNYSQPRGGGPAPEPVRFPNK